MPRIDDVQQQFQQICDDLQAQINNQDARYSVQEAALEQVKGMLAELCTQRSEGSNRPNEGGNNGGNSYSRLSRIDFS